MSDFKMRANDNFRFAELDKRDGNIKSAIVLCEQTIEEGKKVGQEYFDINFYLFYAECLIDPSVYSRNNLLKAYEVFELMSCMAYESRQKLISQFGLAFCWVHKIPKEPKSKDITIIGKNILEAFAQDWDVNPALEEKEKVLRLWEPQVNFFIEQFSTRAPIICWEVCEMVRSRFLLIDLGYSIDYFPRGSSNKNLIEEEANLARRLRELNAQISQLRNIPVHSHFLPPDDPNNIASLDKQIKDIDRRLEYIRNQLSNRDKEAIALRRGSSISYYELQHLLMG